MEQMKLVLDIDSFVEAGSTLIGMLNLDEKNDFVCRNNVKRPSENEINCTFKPAINMKSNNMVKKMRISNLNVSLDSNLTKAVKNCHNHNKLCKPEIDEMAECTFHPKITKYTPIKSCYE